MFSRYADRRQAGRLLVDPVRAAVGALVERTAPAGVAGVPRVVVLGLPRGGVPVAREVAAELGSPLDVLVVRKVGLPGQPELGVGAVAEDGTVHLDVGIVDHLGVDRHALDQVVRAERAEAVRRVERYRGGRPLSDLSGCLVVLVDDGLARGVTALAAVNAVRRLGAVGVILAVPVGSRPGVAELGQACDLVVCPRQPEPFGAVARHYRDFAEVSDEEVLAALGR